jgi:molecular chaperone GrpE (heat shock protein)
MKPVERPCLPVALQQEAEQAERRKDEAIERLRALAVEAGALEVLPTGDPFEQGLHRLIDADKNVIDILRRKAR